MTTAGERTRSRAGAALRRPHNWMQLAKFCTVGATGYVVNLAVFTLLARGLDVHYLPRGDVLVPRRRHEQLHRGTGSGRSSTQRGHVAYQGLRFLVVSAVALVGESASSCASWSSAGLAEVVAQAIAILLVTPLNFVGNKLWSFRSTR